jgi:hypothetical protein
VRRDELILQNKRRRKEDHMVPEAAEVDALPGGRDAFHNGFRPSEIFYQLSAEECRHYLSEWLMNAEREGSQPSHLEVGVGYSLAHLAAHFCHVAVLKYINTKKSEMLNKKTGAGETLAHLAAENGHVDVLRFLSEIGFAEQFSKKTDEEELTPARLAVGNDHVGVLRYFSEIDSGLLAEDASHEDGSLLDYAVSCERISCVSFLHPDSPLCDQMVPGF